MFIQTCALVYGCSYTV